MTNAAIRAPRILIMEDNEQVSLSMYLVLEREGYDVAAAPTPARARELQHRLPADVLIADLLTLKAEAPRVIDRFKHEFPGTRVVAMARGATECAGIDCADATLRMPYDAETLLSTIRSLTCSLAKK